MILIAVYLHRVTITGGGAEQLVEAFDARNTSDDLSSNF